MLIFKGKFNGYFYEMLIYLISTNFCWSSEEHLKDCFGHCSATNWLLHSVKIGILSTGHLWSLDVCCLWQKYKLKVLFHWSKWKIKQIQRTDLSIGSFFLMKQGGLCLLWVSSMAPAKYSTFRVGTNQTSQVTT